MANESEPPSTPPVLTDVCDTATADPPPPYPYPSRERRVRTSRRSQHSRLQISQSSSGDTQYPTDDYADEDVLPTETTPFLGTNTHPRYVHQGPASGRPRSHSFTSTMSAAPSLAHTVLSLFQGDEDDTPLRVVGQSDSTVPATSTQQRGTGFFSRAAWKRYFRPIFVKSYYRALFHLAVLNFPYGLIAWVYLFVFTVTGTTLLVALPLGAVLCFFDLLGARAFARGELALQTRFHAPFNHTPPYPPRPIFTRYREPTSTEVEMGHTRQGLVRENSFYKNTYAMFTDPTSYQALFYFIVIKPAITLLISIAIVAIGIPAFVLVLPAPAMLRAVRKVGIWQANVAVEGLYVAVR
ncbi:hypothetical protein JR316_0001636 [Psilocybe cubensis]|uniref:Sensor domain-containing protein n=2 Tax=Psilocybe cubensis TaxID=181762 RepID=A0A8H7Y6Q2_PSICU|nr:hypothetical protein JR316_0001636 [Psilocybe cubensis]KAH9484736.1 hypothetical protein JR316_0001636 [Psilocybe cubensis]